MKTYYKDAFIVRYADDESLAVVKNEVDFRQEVERREMDPFWKRIKCIMLTPPAKTGLGKCFTFNFIASSYSKPVNREYWHKHIDP